ncbi:MAG: hypothetical protein LBD37_05815 [Treponema sp.]|jgi:hypothetical protein|nr:hypothetical protein [Treponema sp.]
MKKSVLTVGMMGLALVVGLALLVGCPKDGDDDGGGGGNNNGGGGLSSLEGIWINASDVGIKFEGTVVSTSTAPQAGQSRNWQPKGTFQWAPTAGTTVGQLIVTPTNSASEAAYTVSYNATTKQITLSGGGGTLTAGTYTKQ